jgi:mRNA-degrading endonuclease RelE of RelBE toxin-antitoxin system
MDKIQKALAKLPKQHREIFYALMVKLMARDFLGLNVAKIKGYKEVYRIKHGRLRVVFKMSQQELSVLEVGLRSEKTYRNF